MKNIYLAGMCKVLMYLFLSQLLTVQIVVAQENVDEDENKKKKAQIVDINAGSYFFKPDHIVVKVNEPVELHVIKESGFVPHDITMQESEAGMEFSESLETDKIIIKFIPLLTGRFPFYCDGRFLFFESHRDKGMEGIIEVVD